MPEGAYPRQRTPTQLLRDIATGQPADWPPGLVIAGGAGVVTEVYNFIVDKRKPESIRIQNVGTQAVKWAANCAKANAADNNRLTSPPDVGQMKDQYSGIISGGTAIEDGLGGIEIFKQERVTSIYIWAAAAYNVCVSKRYAQAN